MLNICIEFVSSHFFFFPLFLNRAPVLWASLPYFYHDPFFLFNGNKCFSYLVLFLYFFFFCLRPVYMFTFLIFIFTDILLDTTPFSLPYFSYLPLFFELYFYILSWFPCFSLALFFFAYLTLHYLYPYILIGGGV